MDEAPNEIQVPADIAVGVLRNEIARLNDERMTLAIQVNYLSQVVNALQAVIAGNVTIVDPPADGHADLIAEVDDALSVVAEDDTP